MESTDFKELLKEKICELFSVCDKDNKGYIVKQDMFRLSDSISMPAEHLERVFEMLDVDGNSQLSIEEFVNGFATATICDPKNIFSGFNELGNKRLVGKERDQLDLKLIETEKHLKNCQIYIQQLQAKEDVEKKDRAKYKPIIDCRAALRMSEKIVIERMDLVEQLDDLPMEKTYKVMLAGDSGVGKSSFIRRLCDGNFEDSFAPTIG
ncbi:LOW QUALITY PROTEIN: EF-hand calcium-binding domain-containing protein 4B-like [Octopus sinensis]|uniref:LOW QUALITY PROTEIN: EF-hand calcium-binding domain-containing protein 4B-like n=1 Tax=Octopus sinensis TaxID=2607531 RepID=A0A6P7TRZ7_9MOLL|nr:LOW QUALITY PROTEIN: EF-hand calcium-binding domain-containing protein 4B-like [Octopus sinensis]